MSTSKVSPGRPRGPHTVLVILTILWTAWLAWFLVAPDRNPDGQCEGLGFGCTLTPNDFAEFVGAIVVAPVSVIVLAVTLVVRLVRISSGSPRTVWDVLIGGLLITAIGLFLAGTVAGAL